MVEKCACCGDTLRADKGVIRIYIPRLKKKGFVDEIFCRPCFLKNDHVWREDWDCKAKKIKLDQ